MDQRSRFSSKSKSKSKPQEEPLASEDFSGEPLGLIAGAGDLPIEASRMLRAQGVLVHAVGFEGLTSPSIEKEVAEVCWLRLGQLSAMASALEHMNVRRVLLLGKVPKSLLFDGRGIAVPDEEAIALLSEERDRGDEPLMAAISSWLEARHFRLCDQGEILAPMVVERGTLGTRSPSDVELRDWEMGSRVVAQLGLAGIGQCVVVREGSVLAVEAIEGTDATILRAGVLGGQGATVTKASRPGQDRRFDLPAIGLGTIQAMVEAGATALAIEAGSTLLIDRVGTLKAADQAKIAVWGFSFSPQAVRSGDA